MVEPRIAPMDYHSGLFQLKPVSTPTSWSVWKAIQPHLAGTLRFTRNSSHIAVTNETLTNLTENLPTNLEILVRMATQQGPFRKDLSWPWAFRLRVTETVRKIKLLLRRITLLWSTTPVFHSVAASQ